MTTAAPAPPAASPPPPPPGDVDERVRALEAALAEKEQQMKKALAEKQAEMENALAEKERALSTSYSIIAEKDAALELLQTSRVWPCFRRRSGGKTEVPSP